MATGGEAKVREGDKLIMEAEKCLKTNWLKWSAEYAGAAHAFDKAALCYRNGKAYDRARQAYERAAEAHYKNAASFQAGRSMEQAAHVAKEMKQVEQAAMLLETASNYYHESGHGDTAGQVLTKAAKLVDPVNPLRAVDYHLACAELHLVEDKQREATKATRNAVNMAARARDLDKLKEVLEKLRALYEELNMHKQLWNVAAIELVLHLHRDDTVAANDTVVDAAKIPGFLESDECPAMQRLCDAFQERDGDAVVEACGDVVFRSMETDVAKLALDLKKKFEYSSPTHTASTSSSTKTSSSSSSSTGPSSTKSPPPSASTVTAGSSAGSGRFADMKSELFGGGSTSGEERKNTKQKQPVIEETVESEGDKIERASEEEREEEGEGEGEEEGEGEGEEEGEEKGDDENAYGGALT